MIADTLSLGNQDGTTVDYAVTSRSAGSSTRVVLADAIGLTRQLHVANTTSTRRSDGALINRHAITLRYPFMGGADLAVPMFTQVACVFTVPVVNGLDDQNIRDQAINLVDFLTDGATGVVASVANLDQVLRGGA
jgi:hypothetical protein